MSRRTGSDVFADLMVGAFMVAVLGLLVYFTIVISGVDVLSDRKRVPVTVYFSDVGGLKERDSVVMRGMTVGAVTRMQLAAEGVAVELLLQKDVTLNEGYRISVNSSSLLGGHYLLIENEAGSPLPQDAVLRGVPPDNWMRDLEAIVAHLRSITDGGHIHNIITNLEASVGSVRIVSQRIEDGEGVLGKLLSKDEMTLYDDLAQAVANLRDVSSKLNSTENSLGKFLSDDGSAFGKLDDSLANLKTISERLERGEGTVGKLLSADSSLYDNLEQSLANLKSVSERLEKGEGTLGKLLSGDNELYTQLDATVANLRTVSDRLVAGEGTLGKLSKEEELYTEVQGLIKDVRQTVDNFRDTTPISAFASLLMGGL